MAELKDRIKDLRVEKGLRQIDLANALSVSKATVSLWERGNARPEFGTCEMMADFFHVTMAYLLGSSDDRMPVTTDVDWDELAMQGICEDYRELFMKYVRLSEKSKAIVEATINGAFQADKDTDDLKEDNQYLIQVMDRVAFERRKREKESGES